MLISFVNLRELFPHAVNPQEKAEDIMWTMKHYACRIVDTWNYDARVKGLSSEVVLY